MNQRVVDVTLTEIETVDILNFHLDPKQPDAYTVNLNSPTSQNELKNVFSKLLQLLLEEKITLNLIVAEGYKRDLYKDVCNEYISDLNREIEQVRTNIQAELT